MVCIETLMNAACWADVVNGTVFWMCNDTGHIFFRSIGVEAFLIMAGYADAIDDALMEMVELVSI